MMVKEKLPDQVKLPFGIQDKFPFDFSFKLPFEIPDPGSLLGDSKVPNKEKITKDLSEYEHRIAVNEIREETAAKFSITVTELNKIRNKYKLSY